MSKYCPPPLWFVLINKKWYQKRDISSAQAAMSVCEKNNFDNVVAEVVDEERSFWANNFERFLVFKDKIGYIDKVGYKAKQL